VEHLEALAGKMRKADLEEIRIGCPYSPSDILLMSFCLSANNVYTWMHGDQVAAIFGCSPIHGQPGVGCPWFLGSSLVERNPRYFVQIAKTMIPHWLSQYPLLENLVHDKNEVSIRFLRWAGFTLDDPEPFEDTGENMIHFYMERP
jgi:hypothetical protein